MRFLLEKMTEIINNNKVASVSLSVPFLCVCLQSTRQERTLMKPFYDRYRLLKQMLHSSAVATVITTIVSKHLMLNFK